MQTLLRHIPTGQYFQSLEKWTPDRDEAYDFGLIAKAVRFAHQVGLPDLELILGFDRPEQATGIPLEKFRLGLSHTRKRKVSGTVRKPEQIPDRLKGFIWDIFQNS